MPSASGEKRMNAPARDEKPTPEQPDNTGAKVLRSLLAIWIVGFLLFVSFGPGVAPSLAYSELHKAASEGRVVSVDVSDTQIRGTMRESMRPDSPETEFTVGRLADDQALLERLLASGATVNTTTEVSAWFWLLPWLLPAGLVMLWLVRSARSAVPRIGEGAMSFGRSRAKVFVEKEIKVRFSDVAGVDEAVDELREVVELLSHPEKYLRLGGRSPKGILLVGPPGTGKTLLARAVAGEAKVPFFNISGSEFVELFVGVGAARVRDLFAQAKEKAPCIIFIDELDALGKARGLGPTAHEEREQTLNQLLVEMDGFDPRSGVILMAATNRPEILDPALLRAGRFDRHVLVDRPDRTGRRAILAVHSRNVTLAPDADLDAIAAMTAGMVGADLANLVNEATLIAVRHQRDVIGTAELAEAVERVIAGLEKKSRVLTPAEKSRVAHHEIGHALVAMALPGPDVVRKISVIPRGIAGLGYTLQLPTEDRFLLTQSELENKLAVLLGGRVAEELIYDDVSTGAQDDLSKATEIARRMVRSYGMSRKLGHLSFDRPEGPLFLGAAEARPDYGDEVAKEIDAEIRWIVDQQHSRATRILTARRDLLRRAARELVERESITGDELVQLAADHPFSAEADRRRATTTVPGDLGHDSR